MDRAGTVALLAFVIVHGSGLYFYHIYIEETSLYIYIIIIILYGLVFTIEVSYIVSWFSITMAAFKLKHRMWTLQMVIMILTLSQAGT